MSKSFSTVSRAGQVTIPIELRRKLGLQTGDTVAFELTDGDLLLLPVKSRLLAGYGSVKPLTRPEDFRRIRREVQEEIAENARSRSAL